MKKLFAMILSVLLLCGIVTLSFAAEEVPVGYTPIRTAEDLNNVRNNLSGKYILMNDIDLSGFGEWTPIGEKGTPFAGELNGNGYSIHRADARNGLFYYTRGAVFRHLYFEDCRSFGIESEGEAAAIAIHSEDTVFEKCVVCGSIESYSSRSLLWSSVTSYAGGLVASATQCSFRDCGVQANITMYYERNGYEQDERAGGGIIGKDSGSTLENCYASGTVQAFRVELVKFDPFEVAYLLPDLEDHIVIGSLIGKTDGSSQLKNCFGADSVDKLIGNGAPQMENTEIHSNAEMMQTATYRGFDFENTWMIKEGAGYPELQSHTQAVKTESIRLRYKEKRRVVAADIAVLDCDSEDPAVAVASKDGMVTATGIGTTVAYFTSADRTLHKVQVTVSYAWWQQLIRYLFFGFLWY